MTTIDLNSDVGEAFGPWPMGDDEGMLGLVSSANIACGFHAGDPRAMSATTRLAAQHEVAVGAHVGYRDLAGFGRRAMDVASEDLIPEIIYQIGALQAIARAAGTTVSYVKPHGALYNTIVHDARQSRDVATAIADVDDSLVLLGLPGSQGLLEAERAGLPTAVEAFADRAYTPEGTLVSRRQAGAVLTDPAEVARRMVQLVERGTLQSIDGSEVAIRADSICVHGDSPGAVAMAQRVHEELRGAGVEISPFTRS
ncbi:MAG: LamB/YcsF family protein [Micrococcaceae bacterium]